MIHIQNEIWNTELNWHWNDAMENGFSLVQKNACGLYWHIIKWTIRNKFQWIWITSLFLRLDFDGRHRIDVICTGVVWASCRSPHYSPFFSGIHWLPLDFLYKRVVRSSFDVFFDVSLTKLLYKQWRCRWFQTGKIYNKVRTMWVLSGMHRKQQSTNHVNTFWNPL